MKVLIITYYWPPAGGSGVQRWLKFVKYLNDFGIQPVVYTVDNPAYPITDESLLGEVPGNVEILRNKIWEPNNIIGKRSKQSDGFLDPKPGRIARLLQYIRANYFIPDARKYWIKPSVKYLSKYLIKSNIDVVISSGPPHSMHLIGLELKKVLPIKWIADFRDPWTEIDYFHQLPLSKKSLAKHQKMEMEVLKYADQVLVVSDTMKRKYNHLNNKIQVISNGFDDYLFEEEVKLDEKFTMVHIGMMNSDRNPKALWEVLSEILNENKEFRSDFQFKLIGKVANDIVVLINNYALNEYVELVDYQLHKDVLKYQKSAQVLLLSVNDVPGAEGIVTGKIFEYLQARRPILAIAPSNGDLAKIIKTTDSGVVVDFMDKMTLKNSILDFYSKYKAGKLEVNSKHIDRYHRRNLTEQLSQIIKKMSEEK